MNTQTVTSGSDKSSAILYRRLAWIAPLFFLIKGLLWLAIPFVVALYGLD